MSPVAKVVNIGIAVPVPISPCSGDVPCPRSATFMKCARSNEQLELIPDAEGTHVYGVANGRFHASYEGEVW